MTDQTEIKKIITVDLGNTTTSLKEYKKHIDDLRGSLLQLDESSEEYNKIAKEIQVEQDKLNEVMKVGKQNTDAADGSYNKLVQTMAELKKQWKATADEAERADLGKQILSINNQLKDLDASTGNFQRNVGDYGNAFEAAFEKCMGGLQKIDGPLGELGGTAKDMIPVIKNINKTAVAGLSGIKKGIASTGIGLLVIGVAELITHWKELTAAIGISEDDINEFKKSAIETMSKVVSGVFGVGNAIGNFMIAPIKVVIEEWKGLGNIIKDIFTGNWSNIKEDAMKALSGIKDVALSAVDFSGNFEEGKELGNKFVGFLDNVFGSKEVEEETKDVGKTIGKNIIKGVEEGSEEEVTTIDNTTQAILDRLHKRNTDEIELLREKYEQEKALLEQYGLDTTQLQQEFEEEAEKIIDKRLDAERKAITEQQKAEEEEANKAIAEAERVAKMKRHYQQTIISSTASMFGALSDLSEEGSEEQKAFSVMQTIINTLQAIMGVWAGYSKLGPWGTAAAIAQTAVISATGAATIAKMKSTTKESSSASVSVPQVAAPPMTSVSPLLDEQSDINRMNMSGMQGDSSKTQNEIRCYVVESDIREMTNRVSVVERNATF